MSFYIGGLPICGFWYSSWKPFRTNSLEILRNDSTYYLRKIKYSAWMVLVCTSQTSDNSHILKLECVHLHISPKFWSKIHKVRKKHRKFCRPRSLFYWNNFFFFLSWGLAEKTSEIENGPQRWFPLCGVEFPPSCSGHWRPALTVPDLCESRAKLPHFPSLEHRNLRIPP